jgi:hypothetical protein
MDQPSMSADWWRVDRDHIELLAVFHFVGAGLALLAVGGVVAHYSIMHVVLEDPSVWSKTHQPPPPEFIKTVLMIFYLIFGLWFLMSLVLNLLSGIFLRAGKYRTFSLIVAGLNCLHLPLGTVLGVFTIVVLLRNSVRELYEAETQRH